MAVRPIFVPRISGKSLVDKIDIDFMWVAGLAKAQKQKCIRCLHEAAARRGIERPLEISSKSEAPDGVLLSAFNLPLNLSTGIRTRVENVFQGSKVFRDGGPFVDLLGASPLHAKTDRRLCSSGEVIGFRLDGCDWPAWPRTAFYDWVYLTALRQSPNLARFLLGFDGFTDIEFNPQRSINCQAASAALFVALSKRGEIDAVMTDKEAFLERLGGAMNSDGFRQTSLF